MTDIAQEPLETDLQQDSGMNSRGFYIGLAIALGLHLLLISLPIAFWVDMNLYKAWSIDMVQQGFANFYNYSTNCDYPPAYLYVLWAIGKIYYVFDPEFRHTNGLLFMALIKIPPVLADIGASFLIAQILKAHITPDKAYKMALLYALNPLIIFVSAVWGQVDGIISFLMLGVFYLAQQNYVIRAGLLIAVTAVIKPQGLFIAPFLFLSQWFRQAWWTWVAIVSAGLALIWVIIFPFYGINSHSLITPFLLLYKRFKDTADYYNFASVNAFNFWGWANWERDYITFAGISYKVIGLAFLGLLILWLGAFLYRQRPLADALKDSLAVPLIAQSLAVTTLLLGCFMLPTRMHERYMLYGLAFLAITVALIPTIKWIYWGVTLTGAANVGYAYVRYNYQTLFYATPAVWLQSLVYIMSTLNVILFLALLVHTFKSYSNENFTYSALRSNPHQENL